MDLNRNACGYEYYNTVDQGFQAGLKRVQFLADAAHVAGRGGELEQGLRVARQ